MALSCATANRSSTPIARRWVRIRRRALSQRTQDYLAGVLKQHEKTRKDKEDDRTRHIEVLSAHTGPAFLTYRDDAAIDAIVSAACRQAPLYDFVADDGIGHTVWEIASASSCTADELQELFARVPVAYIADGHHRSAAAARYAKKCGFEGEARWFMAVIFPASQLKILAYNRLVADLNGLDDETFLARVAENFTLGKKGSRNCRMYFRGKWTDLSWDIPADADVVSALDVSYLQNRLLAPVLGIGDPRTDARISFMGGIRGDAALAAKVDSGENAVAFAMEPVTVEEMMAIADAGAIMPPKSTWFEPKLRSGLFVHTV